MIYMIFITSIIFITCAYININMRAEYSQHIRHMGHMRPTNHH